MKAALIQLNSAWEDKARNLARAEELLREAAAARCDIAVLPELFATGFSMNVSRTAEDEGGPTDCFLAAAAKNHGIHIIAGLALKGQRGGKARNTASVYDPAGAAVARFTKLHPFSPAREGDFYDTGSHTVTFSIGSVTASVFICYDLRFPEAFRKVARAVQAIFVIASWPAERSLHWEVLLRARAIENQLFVIGVNRTGTDGRGIRHCGGSCVFDPLGKELCRGGSDDELVICSFAHEESLQARAAFPFLKDMRLTT